MDNANLTLHPQQLHPIEQQLLLAHASGMTNRQIAQQIGTDMATVNQLNRQLQKNLEANSLPHAIAQAFIKGILTVRNGVNIINSHAIVRSLCLCLVIISGMQSIDINLMRTRAPQRSNRTPTTVMRVGQAGRNKELNA
ncbi:hypothetical protein A6E13_16445 [Aliivibrio fischeri]|uniref:LuxR C-terminal-related transcriptional regulator n=1 Tax=Aliivibrio fischeri TaxID=668 RepID=UPI00080E4277|nr:LuxR C-terminal-related transcriptional regulator [Aliivibrio fischeri]OCH31811.1 hypothetical protein A6E13_16445 [Aliivibrio fischeri]